MPPHGPCSILAAVVSVRLKTYEAPVSIESFKTAIQSTQKEFESSLKKAKAKPELEKIRVEFLGRNSKITALMKQLKTLPTEDKRIVGPLINDLKEALASIFENRKSELFEEEINEQNLKNINFDVTAYKTDSPPKGHSHPYTHITEEVEDIMMSMGYDIVNGPEIEHDYYNFEALNIPKDHPARDMQDTFWLKQSPWLMRTHTSPVQIHAMESRKPPLAISVSGRCYRPESIDASHETMFLQTEALLVDKNISMAHLIGTAKAILQSLFHKKNLKLRIRPGYFPFVEPGIEIDIACPFCKGHCSTCKQSGWLETIGAGLVHPNVLKAVSIDPKTYSGFAFALGLTRLAMLQYGINDIRHFHSGDTGFLKQF